MKVPSFILPVLVTAAILSGYMLRNVFTQPTTNATFEAVAGETVTCTVQGVKCKGTANFFTNLYADVPGIAGIETFATEHKVIFKYDPTLITPEGIREVMEAPILLNDGSYRQVFVCESMH
ncbi:hypothetical protein KJZ99_05800 [bacterium]|nr:hypothetical protein [bacterium]